MTYLTALKLEREPFSTSPDPRFFYRSQKHFETLNHLEITIRLKRGLSLILGDVGVGKTTLSRTLLQNFRFEAETYLFHMILDPAFSSNDEFLAHLTKLFHVAPFFRASSDYRKAIEHFLYARVIEEHRAVVLVIDEGQKLNNSQLEILRTLLNYETNQQKLLQLVIFGQMELLPRIKKIQNFMDRIAYKSILQPLNSDDTGKLIAYRLKEAGYAEREKLFTPEAVERIYQYSQGYPRRITMICHQAIEKLLMSGAPQVTVSLIEEIIKEEAPWQ